MNLLRAREVVAAGPKTELGLAARLVLWELERREETADPQPVIDSMRLQRELWRATCTELEQELAQVTEDLGDAQRDLAQAAAIREAHLGTIRGLDKRVRDLENADKSELERLRGLETAVWEILDAPTIFTPTRSMQDKIRAHLSPHLAPRQ